MKGIRTSEGVLCDTHVLEVSYVVVIPVVNDLYEVGHQVGVVPPRDDALSQQREDRCLQLGKVPQQLKHSSLRGGRQPGNNTLWTWGQRVSVCCERWEVQWMDDRIWLASFPGSPLCFVAVQEGGGSWGPRVSHGALRDPMGTMGITGVL